MLKTIDIEDWILLLFYLSPMKRFKSELYVQKALFMASHHIERLKASVEYKPYKLGPYSEQIKDNLENLEDAGYIKREQNYITITAEGERKIRERLKLFKQEEVKILEEISEFIDSLDEDELLLFTYLIYGYYEKSDIIYRLLEKREEIATKMLNKGVISTSLAARLAGKSLPDFIKFLKKKGIKPYSADEHDIEAISPHN